jgi:hypothetical protein
LDWFEHPSIGQWRQGSTVSIIALMVSSALPSGDCGVSGPVLMYETSAGNGPLIREFARATPRPVANSLMNEVYRHMPNDTDFTTLKQAGVPGLNFGFIGEPQYYHQPTDAPGRLSLRSLQHQGSCALSLARHFGNLDLAILRGPDAVYFDFLGRVLIHYPPLGPFHRRSFSWHP